LIIIATNVGNPKTPSLLCYTLSCFGVNVHCGLVVQVLCLRGNFDHWSLIPCRLSY
jgi:hypothetical protein